MRDAGQNVAAALASSADASTWLSPSFHAPRANTRQRHGAQAGAAAPTANPGPPLRGAPRALDAGMTHNHSHTGHGALRRARALLALGALLAGVPLSAQSLRTEPRAELQAEAQRLERAGKKDEAAAVRRRLQEGDFRVGERVAVRISAATFIADTPMVQKDRSIIIKELPPLSLVGVLRSELQPTVQRHVARYIRDPQVATQALVQVQISGEVKNPGFYAIPPETPIADVMQVAGGPTQNADFGKSEILRNGKQVMDGKNLRTAITAGQTVEQTRILPGDDIRVGFRQNRNWLQVVQTMTFAVSAVLGLRALGLF